jgi:hypothetical protein
MSSDGLSMPNVELAFAAMEGRGGPDESMQTPSMPRRVSPDERDFGRDAFE